ncbi:YraN family protein [Slackia heliotrinireducens]|uniref:UPF0102 protein Shel_10390 n=1 Tax=Slackia heliotrinireducens (strain ATCC 29202 / DSM 20476 / NCTC 11029 / RHS 1) TaxID=471855 RepID=C7N589_SLAHD|nr:YraN family protein [Slackia heliotrinireducens]ACV22074.1 predicted endonuclease related to Holliday junction resolvase [Slackia heliotrinireducens DSM 20476]VEH00052.1 Uncharacterised protein family UPF0102 [Slackia heliotrinireducens]
MDNMVYGKNPDEPAEVEPRHVVTEEVDEESFGNDEPFGPYRLSREMDPKELGRRGEACACMLLDYKGYEILERNWKCPAGEADIIAIDENGTLVFVEVKTRRGVENGLPEEAIGRAKRARYEKIAAYYLSQYTGPDTALRFDTIALLVMDNYRALVRHIVNAFGQGD